MLSMFLSVSILLFSQSAYAEKSVDWSASKGEMLEWLIKEPQPRTLKDIFWIHFPKAGTSFGNVIYHYGCPDLPPDSSIHETVVSKEGAEREFMSARSFFRVRYPMKTYCARENRFHLAGPLYSHTPLPKTLRKAGTGIVLVRDPVQRLYSAFRNHLHHVGMRNETLAEILRDTVRTPKQFAHFPGIQGCQTKMLLGRGCAYDTKISAFQLRVAKQILTTSFAFVGLTDHYNKSVVLFHAMFGGDIYPVEWSNTRSTAQRASEVGIQSIPDGKVEAQEYDPHMASKHLSSADDPMDYELYLVAVRLFVERLKRYNLHVPEDLQDLSEAYPEEPG